jgi:protein-tyrosine phosphatase
MGISRSATIVIALMMKRQKIDLKTAFRKVIE